MSGVRFKANREKCDLCGSCVKDCPANIIVLTDYGPKIPPEKEELCYKCQHCLAVCPTGAASILGLDPSESLPLAGALPTTDQMEALIKGRRAVRRYKDEDLPLEVINRLLDVAWHAPTGRNGRQVLFTVIDSKDELGKFRSKLLARISDLSRQGKLPQGMERFASFPVLWEEKKVDILFRGAPHFIVASTPKNGVSPEADCLIALSYFELFAQSQGIGTVWDGLAKWAITQITPEMRQELKIPDDHLIGYAMAFGKPAVKYARTVQHGPAKVNKVSIIS